LSAARASATREEQKKRRGGTPPTFLGKSAADRLQANPIFGGLIEPFAQFERLIRRKTLGV